MTALSALLVRSERKRGIADRIKFDGPANVLAWKYPYEDIKWGAQLIVNESQRAILVKDGEQVEMLSPGRHTLSTANLPILGKLFQAAFGGNTPFTAEVWFFNMAADLDVKFGTPTPLQIQEPRFNVIVPVRAHGQLGLRLTDCPLFLREIVGTRSHSTSDEIFNSFRGMVVTKLKTMIAETIVNSRVSLLDIGTLLDVLSQRCRDAVQPEFSRFGLSVVNLNIADVSFPENDPIVMRLRSTLMDRGEFDILGDNRYAAKRTFDVMEQAAQNEGAGGAALGAGFGLGLGANMGAQAANVLNPNASKSPPLAEQVESGPTRISCQHCRKELRIPATSLGKAVRCPLCQGVFTPSKSPVAAPPAPPAAAAPTGLAARLQQLKTLLGEGLITQADFDAKKLEILKDI